MKRSHFVTGLAGAAGAAQFAAAALPAQAAVDEAGIGREVFIALRDDGDLLFDSPYYEHLNEVGSVISAAAASRYPYPIQYHVVKGDSANAFSVPGGNIYVNEPLLRMARNRDELAGVLAHETGHMVLHHVAKRIKNQSVANTIGTILSIPAEIILGPLGALPAEYALGAVADAQDANLSRHIEAQADEEGARIIAATNVYNPYGMIWFFQKMSATYGKGQANWLRDHPLDVQRIDDLKHLFASDPATFGKFTDTQQMDVAYW